MRALLFLLVVALLPLSAFGQSLPFERVPDHPLSSRRAQSNAALWGDVDGDGDLDLYVSNTQREDELWLNEGDESYDLISFGVSIPGTRTSGSWADLDNDGDLDLAVSTFSGIFVLRNDMGSWKLLSQGGGSSRDVNMADTNGDGWLDLFSSVRQNHRNELYLGGTRGFLIFRPGFVSGDADDSVSSGWGDADGDGDLDLYVTNTTDQRNRLYINTENGFVSQPKSLAVLERAYSAGSSWGDVDGDGDLDLFVVNQRGEGNRLFLNEGGAFVEAGDDVLPLRPSQAKSSAFGDVDNDGDLDLVVATKDAVDDLYLNNGDGIFTAFGLGEVGDGWAVGATLTDTDEDGDLDLFISHGANNTQDRNLYYRNRTSGEPNTNWLALDLIGTLSNRSAIGARVDVYARVGGRSLRMTRTVESRTGRTTQSGLRMHVGLGDAIAADSVVIRWPSGARQRLDGLGANQRVIIAETTVTAGEPPLAARRFTVGAAFPNPASGVVTIPVDVNTGSVVTVEVFDARGRRVWHEVASAQSGESLHVEWPSQQTAFAAGTYSIRVRSGQESVVQTVTIVR